MQIFPSHRFVAHQGYTPGWLAPRPAELATSRPRPVPPPRPAPRPNPYPAPTVGTVQPGKGTQPIPKGTVRPPLPSQLPPSKRGGR